jgi:hypothetical protein
VGRIEEEEEKEVVRGCGRRILLSEERGRR